VPVAAQIHYLTTHHSGDGTLPLVLLHGAGGSRLSWPLELRRLRGYPVYTIDLPGHGRSPGAGLRKIDDYVEAVMAWTAALGLEKAVFVGHSLGSAIALRLADLYPRQAAALGLVGAGARLRVHPDLLAMAAAPEGFEQAVETITQWSYSPAASRRLIELSTRRLRETSPAVLHGDLLACDAFDMRSRLEHISQPCLILCGADDRMTPLRYAQFLAQALPSARLEVFPAAGHMLMLEQPQAAADALARFLQDVSPSIL